IGPPGIVEFTSGNNDSVTNAFPTNSSACVRITDLDQNTNSAVIETITAVAASSSGDLETFTLTETGTNTGVFTACLSTSASGGGATNNGTLNAPAGSLITVSYTDPDDPGDTASVVG